MRSHPLLRPRRLAANLVTAVGVATVATLLRHAWIALELEQWDRNRAIVLGAIAVVELYVVACLSIVMWCAVVEVITTRRLCMPTLFLLVLMPLLLGLLMNGTTWYEPIGCATVSSFIAIALVYRHGRGRSRIPPARDIS